MTRALHARQNTADRYSRDAVTIDPAQDEALVIACMSQGGFPRAVRLSDRTVWVNAAGRLWTHTDDPIEPRTRRAA